MVALLKPAVARRYARRSVRRRFFRASSVDPTTEVIFTENPPKEFRKMFGRQRFK